MQNPRLIAVLNRGGIAVIPTDTIYGIVAKVLDREAATRLYRLRRESAKKPFIILIDSLERLREFGITLTRKNLAFLHQVWPGPVSVVLSCKAGDFLYLHLGTGTLAFRLPKSKQLQTLLKETGPLLAPSANPGGKKPATTIAEAKKYFGTDVNMYVGAGRKMSGKPSTLVSLLSGTPRILRQGAVKLKI